MTTKLSALKEKAFVPPKKLMVQGKVIETKGTNDFVICDESGKIAVKIEDCKSATFAFKQDAYIQILKPTINDARDTIVISGSTIVLETEAFATICDGLKDATLKLRDVFGMQHESVVRMIRLKVVAELSSRKVMTRRGQSTLYSFEVKDEDGAKTILNFWGKPNIAVGGIYEFSRLKVDGYVTSRPNKVISQRDTEIKDVSLQWAPKFDKIVNADKIIEGTVFGFKPVRKYRSCDFCHTSLNDESYCRTCKEKCKSPMPDFVASFILESDEDFVTVVAFKKKFSEFEIDETDEKTIRRSLELALVGDKVEVGIKLSLNKDGKQENYLSSLKITKKL